MRRTRRGRRQSPSREGDAREGRGRCREESRAETATCGGGWRATSAATPIVNRERIRALELSTNAPTTPEMLFDSALELTHESGVTLRFTPRTRFGSGWR